MQIALAQINSTLGAFAKNKALILEQIRAAADKKAELVVFPECALMGYQPMDLLERPSIVESQMQELKSLVKEMPAGIFAIVGLITPNESKNGKPYFNSAVLIQKGKVLKTFHKQLLPTYDVFDEARHIESGKISDNTCTIKGKKVLVTICEDIWAWEDSNLSLNKTRKSLYKENPIANLKKQKLDLIVNLSASPFLHGKFKQRTTVVGHVVKKLKAPMIYTNMVGAQDEQIFDGRTFAMDKSGKVVSVAKGFEQDLTFVNFFDKKSKATVHPDSKMSSLEEIRKALVLGIKDYVTKCGMKSVHLGLSGGVDSAVVVCLAVEAFGPKNVTAIYLPGPFSSTESTQLSKELQKNLGCGWNEISIQESYDQFLKTFKKSIGEFEFGLTNENLQARLRAGFLMAFSNLKNSMLLNTSNKSEITMGYSTLYGDLCGGLCPIADLTKKEVFDLAKYYAEEKKWIPKGIITRPPSAELRPNQRDEDTLPPYEVLDPAVKKVVEDFATPKNDVEKRVLKALYSYEYKRWQAPPILKISSHAFGRGRRFPIAHSATE